MLTKKLSKRENPIIRFLILIKKELAIIWADKQALLIIFILPVVATIAVGATGGMSENAIDMLTVGRQVDMGIVNLDTSLGEPNLVLSEEFIEIIDRQDYVTITRYDTIDEAQEALYNEEIIGFAIIQDGFETNVSSHLPAFVEYYSDTLYILASPLMAKKINDAISDFKTTFGYLDDEIVYETEEKYKINSPLFVSLPMIITMTLLAAGLMLATQSVVGDNPLLRVTLSPTSKIEIVTSKIIAYTSIQMMQGLLLLIVPWFAFNMQFPGDFFIVWLSCVFPSFAGVSLGVFMSTIAKTKLQGSQFFMVGFMAIFILGSGSFLPEGTLELVFPMIHHMNLFNLLAYKAVGLDVGWPYVWPQLLFGLAFAFAGYIILKLKKGAI